MTIEITGSPKEIAAFVSAVQEQQPQIINQFVETQTPTAKKTPDSAFMTKRDGAYLKRYICSEIGHILHLMDLTEDKINEHIHAKFNAKFQISLFLSGIALAVSIITIARM